jgi:hypothetical protein
MTGMALGREPVEQGIQRGARHGVDFLARALAVREEALTARRLVDHPAAHRDHELAHLAVDARAPQRFDAARREREVDRAAAFLALGSEWRAALDHDGCEAAAREQDREQASRGSAADDCNALGGARAHSSSVRLSACTAP